MLFKNTRLRNCFVLQFRNELKVQQLKKKKKYNSCMWKLDQYFVL